MGSRVYLRPQMHEEHNVMSDTAPGANATKTPAPDVQTPWSDSHGFADFEIKDLRGSTADQVLQDAMSKFAELDKDHSGTLSSSELKDLCIWMFSKLGRRFSSEEEKQQAIFRQLKRFAKRA